MPLYPYVEIHNVHITRRQAQLEKTYVWCIKAQNISSTARTKQIKLLQERV